MHPSKCADPLTRTRLLLLNPSGVRSDPYGDGIMPSRSPSLTTNFRRSCRDVPTHRRSRKYMHAAPKIRRNESSSPPHAVVLLRTHFHRHFAFVPVDDYPGVMEFGISVRGRAMRNAFSGCRILHRSWFVSRNLVRQMWLGTVRRIHIVLRIESRHRNHNVAVEFLEGYRTVTESKRY